MMDIRGKRIVVTGGAGFLGRAVVSTLRSRGCSSVFAPRKREYDLTDRANVQRLFQDFHPDLVMHLAATVGGIGANRARPGTFFYENAIMGIELIEQARRAGLGKLVLVGTVCAYPKFCPVPFREEDLWKGFPEETNAPYGIAKKSLLVQAQAYRQEFGLTSIYLLPVNLYGPGDNFDAETSHVIPALIRKFIEAKEQKRDAVVVWGTGQGDAGVSLRRRRGGRDRPGRGEVRGWGTGEPRIGLGDFHQGPRSTHRPPYGFRRTDRMGFLETRWPATQEIGHLARGTGVWV